MPDLLSQVTAEVSPRKMTLSLKERELIMAYRAKTAADRAFNDGLDHALEVINNSIRDFGSDQFNTERFIEAITAARRDV